MDRVEVGGLTIAYERAGQGPPVVLLHGYVGDGPATWHHQLSDLSADFTVVVWDTPGAGESDDPPQNFGINGYADCLAAFIDALGLGAVHVVGLSFGGAQALAFQHRHPRQAKTLVLTSAYAGWRGSLPPEVAEARLAQALLLTEKSAQDYVDTLLPTMFALPVAPADFDRFGASLAAFHPAGFRAMALALAEDLRGVLRDVDVPTLLIYGDHDVRAPMEVAKHLHREITGSRLIVLNGAGHVCNLELPDRFNEAVRTFLSDPHAS